METSITPEIVQEFKERMHITHSAEDSNLQRLLSFSYARIKSACGDFDIHNNLTGKELVYERTRYAYNDAVEYFEDNFLSQLHSFGLDNLGDDDA
ncbi:phage gp6-like head-tail connector protein [Alkalihalophilus marmarensis]|uniref:phage gp6-like head-tail connector protein n=1 Tax=Alkalihalophilus marmarensis TaxID=521377 RepID=UPI002E1DA836|nr:phage gp6-like head-tail connector protein [Alkalihalophilus marmarensis]